MNDYADRYQGNPILLFGKPDYYDSPEGKNPWEKVWGLSKYAIGASMGISLLDCFFHTQARNPIEAANCVGYWMVPLVGMSTVFSAVTFMSTNIRGKDDKVNYAMGVLACVPILHAWKKSISFTLWTTPMLLAIALAKKDSKQNGWQFMYEPVHEYGNYVYDFSIIKEEWPKRPY